MIDRLLPGAAASAETRKELTEATLFPAEAHLLDCAAGPRRRQFASARACARAALGELGVAPTPILRGPHGEPLWPEGIVGSITRCRGYSACAVARGEELVSIGIDAEPNEPLPDRLLERVAGPSERERLLADDGAVWSACLDRLLFSAKEAAYKAWFPLARRPLGFDATEVELRPPAPPAGSSAAPERPRPGPRGLVGELDVRLLAPDPPLVGGVPLRELRGRWGLEAGVLAVALTVPR